jgi:hypothetical protein
MLWVFKSDRDAFSAPAIKGQAPSACEQVNIAAKADCGLKLSSYVLENPIIGWALAPYFML